MSRPVIQVACWAACAFALVACLMAVPWTDEVFYADPGVGLALGEGFRSSDWSVWGQSAVWGLSNPGVGLLLAIWCKLFGVAVWSVHLFFATCYAGGWWLLSGWIKRWGHLPEGSRGFLMAYGLASHAMSGNAMHHARPDALWPFLFWLFLSATFGEGTRFKRASGLFALGLLSVFFGLHFCAFFALGATAFWLWRRDSESFILGLWQALGMSVGIILLWAAFSAHGAWDDFVAHRSASARSSLEVNHWLVSPDLYVVTPIMLMLALMGKAPGDDKLHRWMPLLLILAVPLVMHFVGRYQAPYVWMTMAPAMLCAVYVTRSKDFRFTLLAAACACLIVLGLAGRTRDFVKSASDSKTRAAAVAILRESVPTNSAPVLVSVPLYYDVRDAGYAIAVAFDHRVSPRPALDRDARWALLSEVDVPLIIPQLSGRWQEVRRAAAAPFSPAHGGFVLLKRLP